VLVLYEFMLKCEWLIGTFFPACRTVPVAILTCPSFSPQNLWVLGSWGLGSPNPLSVFPLGHVGAVDESSHSIRTAMRLGTLKVSQSCWEVRFCPRSQGPRSRFRGPCRKSWGPKPSWGLGVNFWPDSFSVGDLAPWPEAEEQFTRHPRASSQELVIWGGR
jgi:hypothetical protein